MELLPGQINRLHVAYVFGLASAPHFGATLTLIPLPANVQFGDGLRSDGDGVLDLIGRSIGAPTSSGTPTYDLVVMRSSIGMPFSTVIVSPTGVLLGTQGQVDDFDGDGSKDYVAVTAGQAPSYPAGLAFCRGDGHGGFRAALSIPQVRLRSRVASSSLQIRMATAHRTLFIRRRRQRRSSITNQS